MLRTSNLSIGFDHSSPLLQGVDLSIGKGECILLCGANGSGKTTLMKTLCGEMAPLEGKIVREGEVIMIPTRIPKVRGFRVKDFILSSLPGARSWSPAVGPLEKERERRAVELLSIESLEERDLSTLSDGEFQKCCIAAGLGRLLVDGKEGMKEGLILLDEPTAFLDVDARREILSTLGSLSRNEGISVLFSSHDLPDSLSQAERVLVVARDRRLVSSSGSPEERLCAIAQGFPGMQRL